MSAPVDDPRSLARYLADLERRLGVLESTSRLASSSIKNGTLTLLDDLDEVRARIGLLTQAGGSGDVWGIEVLNQPGTGDWPGGEPYFRATSDGAEFPYATYPGINEATVISVTAAGFTATWSGGTGLLTHKRVASLVWVTTPVGTSGEVRIRERNGAYTSAAVAVPSGSNAYFSIPAAAHGLPLWTGPYIFDVEARRTAGAGNVDVHQGSANVILQPI